MTHTLPTREEIAIRKWTVERETLTIKLTRAVAEGDSAVLHAAVRDFSLSLLSPKGEGELVPEPSPAKSPEVERDPAGTAWRRFADEKPIYDGWGEHHLLTWNTRAATYSVDCIDSGWALGATVEGHPDDLWRWLAYDPSQAEPGDGSGPQTNADLAAALNALELLVILAAATDAKAATESEAILKAALFASSHDGSAPQRKESGHGE